MHELELDALCKSWAAEGIFGISNYFVKIFMYWLVQCNFLRLKLHIKQNHCYLSNLYTVPPLILLFLCFVTYKSIFFCDCITYIYARMQDQIVFMVLNSSNLTPSLNTTWSYPKGWKRCFITSWIKWSITWYVFCFLPFLVMFWMFGTYLFM